MEFNDITRLALHRHTHAAFLVKLPRLVPQWTVFRRRQSYPINTKDHQTSLYRNHLLIHKHIQYLFQFSESFSMFLDFYPISILRTVFHIGCYSLYMPQEIITQNHYAIFILQNLFFNNVRWNILALQVLTMPSGLCLIRFEWRHKFGEFLCSTVPAVER